MDELKQLTQLCERLGAATSAQAEAMARQLLKRADQLAAERNLPREQALQHLLEIVVQGREGNVPPGFTPPTE